MSKNFVVIVSGIGDTLCSENSKRKLKNSEIFVPQVQKALDHLTSSHNSYALVNLYYPSDTFKDVDVLKPYKQTKVLDMKLNGNTILDKSNELSLRTLDLEEILFNGDQFSFIFRPEEYEVYFLGIDLHAKFSNMIEELLKEGYNVKLFSDCMSILPPTHKYISTLNKNKKFEFCSYKNI